MKKLTIYLAAMLFLLAFFGCTINNAELPKFEQSNTVFFERTVDNLQIGSVISSKIPKGSKIAIRSLETNTTIDRPVIAILEDQMIQSIASSGFTVMERDENTLKNMVKESNSTKFSTTNDDYAWLDGKTLKVDTVSIPDNSVSDYVQTNLTSADFILAYRVQECGILYGVAEKKLTEISRNGMVRLHVRLLDARTGEVKYANNITGVNTDSIPKKLAAQLAYFHYTNFYPYDYPVQNHRPANSSIFVLPLLK